MAKIGFKLAREDRGCNSRDERMDFKLQGAKLEGWKRRRREKKGTIRVGWVVGRIVLV